MLLLRDVIYYLSVSVHIYTEAKSDDDLILNKLKKQSGFQSPSQSQMSCEQTLLQWLQLQYRH